MPFITNSNHKIIIGYKERVTIGNRVSTFNEYYVKHHRPDDWSFANQPSKPSYHSDLKCKWLKANFEDFGFPEGLRLSGIHVDEYRHWFDLNRYRIKTELNHFCELYQEKWGISFDYDKYKISNTGIVEIQNPHIPTLTSRARDIENQIVKLLNKKHPNVSLPDLVWQIKKFDKPLKPFDGFTKLGKLLSQVDEAHGSVLGLLFEYFKIHEQIFESSDGWLLDELGFKPCSHCHQLVQKEQVTVENFKSMLGTKALHVRRNTNTGKLYLTDDFEKKVGRCTENSLPAFRAKEPLVVTNVTDQSGSEFWVLHPKEKHGLHLSIRL